MKCHNDNPAASVMWDFYFNKSCTAWLLWRTCPYLCKKMQATLRKSAFINRVLLLFDNFYACYLLKMSNIICLGV